MAVLQKEAIVQDRYQLKKRLGVNGSKQTWLTENLATGTEVTVKALYFGQGMEWQDLKLFEREAQTIKSLSHPRIPRYQDSFWLEQPEGNYFCMVQDYIPGISLAEKVRSGWRLGDEEVGQVAKSILEILVYLHSQNPAVVHRDIKPSNLIWGPDDEIYLVDFGAVQAEVSSGRTMTVVGTYGYMPPEQFGGRTVPASDLYGLGITLLFLLTGTNPADLPQQDLKIQFRDKVSVNRNLKSWLERMIEPSLERRFQSAEEALKGMVEEKIEIVEPQYTPSANRNTSDYVDLDKAGKLGLAGTLAGVVAVGVVGIAAYSIFGLMIGGEVHPASDAINRSFGSLSGSAIIDAGNSMQKIFFATIWSCSAGVCGFLFSGFFLPYSSPISRAVGNVGLQVIIFLLVMNLP